MESAGIGVTAVDSTSTNRAAIQQEDFLKVLLAQLQFQDPLKPLDNNEFIAQFAQMTTLAQTQQLNDKVDAALSGQNAGQAINLVGRTVEAITDSSVTVGEVVAVAFENGTPQLTVRNSSGGFIAGVGLGQIRLIR